MHFPRALHPPLSLGQINVTADCSNLASLPPISFKLGGKVRLHMHQQQYQA
jgi:hypothetical protein